MHTSILSILIGAMGALVCLACIGFLPRRRALESALHSARTTVRVPRWWDERGARLRRRQFDRAVTAWVDLLYVASASGMSLRMAVEQTAGLTEEPLNALLEEVEARAAAGGTFLDLLEDGLEERGGGAAAQVAHLLSDSSRRGLPLGPALTGLRGDLLTRERHRVLAQVKTLGLKITLGTVLFLFPPAFVVVLLPSVLTFLSW